MGDGADTGQNEGEVGRGEFLNECVAVEPGFGQRRLFFAM